LAEELTELVERAWEKKLRMPELQGGFVPVNKWFHEDTAQNMTQMPVSNTFITPNTDGDRKPN
jgi:hypothetical protein